MKTQLPTESKAPPVRAWPLVQPRASFAPSPMKMPPLKAAAIRCLLPIPGPRSTSMRMRPASHADVKPPSVTPTSSRTSQSFRGLRTPSGKYGAMAGDVAPEEAAAEDERARRRPADRVDLGCVIQLADLVGVRERLASADGSISRTDRLRTSTSIDREQSSCDESALSGSRHAFPSWFDEEHRCR